MNLRPALALRAYPWSIWGVALTLALMVLSGQIRGDEVRVERVGQWPGWPRGVAYGVAVSGNYAYVADWDAGLQVIDVSDPANPQRVGRCDAWYARGVAVSGNYAYVAGDWAGLHVIDVRNPANPRRVGGYDTPGVAWGVAVSGSYAYVADVDWGLQILRLSVPGALPPTIAGVRAGQRPGTQLVDITYDLADADSPTLTVSIAVSTNGGASYTLPATSFTGALGAGVTPGFNKRITWNAGVDWPNQFSANVRFRVTASDDTATAGSSSAESNLTMVDTRVVRTGSIVGQVFGDGIPLSGAQIRVLNTMCATNSGGSGEFYLTNVPFGDGYVVAVAASGFAPSNIVKVQVTASPKHLGWINLRPLGVRKVIPLVPDLNPAVSRVEEGGVAYRYYRVVSADGKTPAGGVRLQARVAGGDIIPQAGDVADHWLGRAAGVSDADGVLRIRIPSTAIGGAGTTRTVEVLDGGIVVQSFDVRVANFMHEKIWGHRLDASVAGKLGGVRLEPGGKLETEVRHAYRGSGLFPAVAETIERSRSLTGKAGVEASVGSFKLGSVKGGAKAGVGGYMDLQWSGKWSFDPDTHDGFLNMRKVYYSFGDIIFLGPLGAEFYGKLDNFFCPGLEDALMIGSGGEVRVGGYYEGEAGFGVGKMANVNIRVGAGFEGNVGGYLGYDRTYFLGQIREHTAVFGLTTEERVDVGAAAAFAKFNRSRLRGLGLGLNLGVRNRGGARIETDGNSGWVKEASIELENEVGGGVNLELFGWKGVAAPLSANEKLAITESYTLTFSDANAFSQLAALGALWNEARPGSGVSPQLRNDAFHESCVALADVADQTGRWLTYERSVRRTFEGEFAFPVGANTLAAALELDFTAETERGASMVVERGVLLGGRLFPQEYQPDRTLSLIPTDSIFNKELAWLSRAEFPPISGFSRFAEYVSPANPNLTIGGRFSMFFHDVGQGAQILGSAIMRTVSGGNAPLQQRNSPVQSGPQPGPLQEEYLPAPGQTNYIYGISGLLQLTPTNAFPGTATLVMLYSDDQAFGLNEGDLRIYRLADGTNQWQLMGGVVDAVSNSVTVVISNFGTYGIAAPMPAGQVNLWATNYNLVANGTNELTLTATNLLLNTGAIASNAWLFTVHVSGIELLDQDVSTNWPGVQVASSNGTLEVHLRAPLGGAYASVTVSSVAGDARGQIGLNLIDRVPPAAPTNILATAGQSRIWLSWPTNREPDIAGYRVYYSSGVPGPPWDGTAAIEGMDSPVSVVGTNCLLRGLALGTNYFVSIAAVDTSGNESALSSVINTTTSQQPPAPPTGVAVRFGDDGTNVLMWTLSEDDGYNDRDVTGYEVWQAVMPGTNWMKVGDVPAGIGLFSTTNISVAATQCVRYAVRSVDSVALTSDLALANRVMPGGSSVDNDGDGMPDGYENQYSFLDPNNPNDASLDYDGDGMSNLAEYLAGTAPDDPLSYLRIKAITVRGTNGVEIVWGSAANKLYTVQRAGGLWPGAFTNLAQNLLSTPPENVYLDTTATNAAHLFYRVKVETGYAVDPLLDTDGDGIPDAYENQYSFLDPNNPNDASLDYDGDGMSNLAEYRAGTAPDDPLSYLRITAVTVRGTNGVEIAWGSAANKFYTVQRAGGLWPGAFTNLAQRLLSTPPQNVYLDTTATNAAQLFYRIQVE